LILGAAAQNSQSAPELSYKYMLVKKDV